MRTKQEIIDYCMTFEDVYMNTPFKDENWILLRYKKNTHAFAWAYERHGHTCVNVKVDPQWRDFWRELYSSVTPGYHQNKDHWNTIILDGTVKEDDIKTMIRESYEIIKSKR